MVSGGTVTSNARMFRSITLKKWSMPSLGIEGPANYFNTAIVSKHHYKLNNIQHEANTIIRYQHTYNTTPTTLLKHQCYAIQYVTLLNTKHVT